MIEWINARRKMIAAALGLVLILGHDYLGLKVDDANTERIIDMALGLLTLFGVERTTNK